MPLTPTTEETISAKSQPAPLATRNEFEKTVPPNWQVGLVKLLVFFGLAILAAFALDFTIKLGMRKVDTAFLGALNREMSGRVNSEILISGSSRGLCSYDPRILQQMTGRSVFNISQDATRTDFQLAFLKAYLRHNAKPKILIQNLDFHSFGLSREIPYPGLYAPYLNEPEIYDALHKVDPGVWKWKYCPLYCLAVEDDRLTWMLGAARLFGHNPREILISGFGPESKHWSGEFEAWKRQNPHGQITDFDAGGIRVMEELLTLCKDENIQVIFVFAPVYNELNPLIANRDQIFAEFEALSRRFDVPLWDYSQAPLTSQREYFGNSLHMNSAGAEIFSRDLADRLAAFLADSQKLAPTNGGLAGQPAVGPTPTK